MDTHFASSQVAGNKVSELREVVEGMCVSEFQKSGSLEIENLDIPPPPLWPPSVSISGPDTIFSLSGVQQNHIPSIFPASDDHL